MAWQPRRELQIILGHLLPTPLTEEGEKKKKRRPGKNQVTQLWVAEVGFHGSRVLPAAVGAHSHRTTLANTTLPRQPPAPSRLAGRSI